MALRRAAPWLRGAAGQSRVLHLGPEVDEHFRHHERLPEDEVQEIERLCGDPGPRAEVLGRAREVLREAGLEAERQVRAGAPAAAIPAEAREGGYKLAVVGSAGASGLERFPLGTVWQGVCDAAEKSVPVVKPGAAAGMALVAAGADEGKTLGQMLRERREARGLTREQAAHAARVQPVFVRALEEDDYRPVPDERYLSRFVYEYARFLQLDPAAADAAFRRQFRRPPAPGHLYRAGPPLAAFPWRRVLAGVALILPAIPLAFIIASLAEKERVPPSTGPAGRAPAGALPGGPVLAPAGEVSAGPAEVGAAVGPRGSDGGQAESWSAPPLLAPPQAQEGERPRRHLLEVRARELAWLAVRVDGGAEREVLLREGEVVRWGAEREFVLTLGNVGGVDLVLDGRPVPLRGRRGEVIRDLRLPPAPSR